MLLLERIAKNDFFILARFVVPLCFTDVTVDIAEQFLNRSIANSASVVETLAAFGLAYWFVKFFVGMMGEVKQVGLVLVHDRPVFHKLLACILAMAVAILVLLIITAETRLGVWLIDGLHGVSAPVGTLTRSALLYLSAYTLIDAVAWYHGGVLLQFRHSTLVGAASLADIMAQIFSVAILLYTPLVCANPIAVPILAAYAGVLTRCTTILIGFYRLVYPRLSKEPVVKVTLWKFVTFLSPLMFVLGVQRISRPVINLLVARFSGCVSVAVLTATYPVGHLTYGWLNQLRPVIPAFMQKTRNKDRPPISGRKIAIFIAGAYLLSLCLSVLVWIPPVSVAIMQHVIGLPHSLALLCVHPLAVFGFFGMTVVFRSSLTGWLTLHHQTKLVTPSGFVRSAVIPSVFFTLWHLGVSGALLGALALFSGFFAEMLVVVATTVCYLWWRRCKRSKSESVSLSPSEVSVDDPTALTNGSSSGSSSSSSSRGGGPERLELQEVNGGGQLKHRTVVERGEGEGEGRTGDSSTEDKTGTFVRSQVSEL